jgi:hypothetical protein
MLYSLQSSLPYYRSFTQLPLINLLEWQFKFFAQQRFEGLWWVDGMLVYWELCAGGGSGHFKEALWWKQWEFQQRGCKIAPFAH